MIELILVLILFIFISIIFISVQMFYTFVSKKEKEVKLYLEKEITKQIESKKEIAIKDNETMKMQLEYITELNKTELSSKDIKLDYGEAVLSTIKDISEGERKWKKN